MLRRHLDVLSECAARPFHQFNSIEFGVRFGFGSGSVCEGSEFGSVRPPYRGRNPELPEPGQS
jgi:hypothetical protein